MNIIIHLKELFSPDPILCTLQILLKFSSLIHSYLKSSGITLLRKIYEKFLRSFTSYTRRICNFLHRIYTFLYFLWNEATFGRSLRSSSRDLPVHINRGQALWPNFIYKPLALQINVTHADQLGFSRNSSHDSCKNFGPLIWLHISINLEAGEGGLVKLFV